MASATLEAALGQSSGRSSAASSMRSVAASQLNSLALNRQCMQCQQSRRVWQGGRGEGGIAGVQSIAPTGNMRTNRFSRETLC